MYAHLPPSWAAHRRQRRRTIYAASSCTSGRAACSRRASTRRSALRFLFTVTLGRPDPARRLTVVRQPLRLLACVGCGGVRDRAVPLRCPGARLNRFVVPIPGRRGGYQSVEQFSRRPRHCVDRALASGLIRFRRSSKTAQLTNKLQSRCSDFCVRSRRFEVVQRFDIATHRDPRWRVFSRVHITADSR